MRQYKPKPETYYSTPCPNSLEEVQEIVAFLRAGGFNVVGSFHSESPMRRALFTVFSPNYKVILYHVSVADYHVLVYNIRTKHLTVQNAELFYPTHEPIEDDTGIT